MKNAAKILVVALVLTVLSTGTVSAASQGKHDKSDEKKKYDCSLVSSPGKIKKVSQSDKKEPFLNREIILKWDDSFRAHVVEIEWGLKGGKQKKTDTGDDGKKTFSGLQNGKLYTFKVRGISNCGKGKWTSTFVGRP